MRPYPVCVIHPVADGLKFGLLPALAIGMTVCLMLEFGIRLLDRSNGPVLMIPFCRSTKEADTNLPLAVVIVERYTSGASKGVTSS